MAKHMVKCFYCNEMFDANAEPYVMANARRYAHKVCSELRAETQTKEEKDKEILEQYIKDLFNISYITPKIEKQIKFYHKDKNYSYSGMHKTLKYYFEIQNGSIEKTNGGIGIIPYIWDEAFAYWRSLWEIQQKNQNVKIQNYILPAKEVYIKFPQREPMKHTRKLFNFLNEGGDENG